MTPDEIDEEYEIGKKWLDDHLELPGPQIAYYEALAEYYKEMTTLARKALKHARTAK